MSIAGDSLACAVVFRRSLFDLVSYLAELSNNNNRAWFVMNKPRYDILREEFLAVVTEVIAQIGKFDPLVRNCDPKKALFRINRDVRFSKEKSPYKTNFSAAIVPGNLRRPSQGGGSAYYFHISANRTLFCAVGEYRPPAERLKQIRSHIEQDGANLLKVLQDKKLQNGFEGLREEDKLQRPPKGFNADHPQVEFIKLKHYMISTQFQISQLKTSAMLIQTLVGRFKDAYPLVCWLRGAS